jgi:hypothetical protein
MKPPLPRTLSAVPQTLHARLEIAKAIRTLVGPGEDELLRQRRAEIAAIRHDLEALSRDIRKAGEEWLALAKAELRAALKKYSPDQPRVPAGNPDGGQWTNENSLAPTQDYSPSAQGSSVVAPRPNAILSDATPDAIRPGAQYAQLNVQNHAKTANPLINNTTDILLQTLARIHALAGDGSGPWYGTRIHLMFASDVRLQNLPGIGRTGVEQSFSLGDIADYGEDGTVRVDVYMRDEAGRIVAIWDVKTGGAVLTGARLRQLRAEAGVGSDVRVIELHVTRGATLKARTWRSVLNIIAVTR